MKSSGFLFVIPTGLERIVKSFYFTAAFQYLTDAGLVEVRDGSALPVRKEGRRVEIDLDTEADPDLAAVASVGYDLWERYERFYRAWKDSGSEVEDSDLTYIKELGEVIEQRTWCFSLDPGETMRLGERIAAGLAWKVLEGEGYEVVVEPRGDGRGDSVLLKPRSATGNRADE